MDQNKEQEFVDFNVQDWYAQAVRDSWPQNKIQEYIETQGPPFVGHGGPEKGNLGVQGPAHWSDIWVDMAHIGEDHLEDTPEDEPLIDDQKQWLDTIEDGMFTDIEFLQYLDAGAFGEVWVASVTYKEPIGKGGAAAQRVTPNMCKACKIIKFPADMTPVEGVTRILTDFSVIEGLKHDNLNTFDDYISVPDTGTGFPYSAVLLFMDLCQGDLEDILNRSQYYRKLTPLACKRWFRQIATGIQFLHQNRIEHNDLSLKNILYRLSPGAPNQEITFRVCDFGGAVKHPVEHWVFLHDIHNLGMCLFSSYCGPFIFDGPEPIPQQIAHIVDFDDGLVHIWPHEEHRDQALSQLIIAMTQSPPNPKPTIDEVLTHPWLEMIGLWD